MDTLQQTIRVQFQYSVHFTRHIFQPNNLTLRDVIAGAGSGPRRTLFVIDNAIPSVSKKIEDQISAYCHCHASWIQQVAKPLLIPGGEAVKNDDHSVELVREAIHHYGICRHSFVTAIGGGALLDAVGYAAATSHRGVRLIRVPTTVLAQNDSGVGVKNSINHFGKKNFLGTFTPPYAVINDFAFLDTLPMRDWRSGIAEAVKVALIKDSALFDYIEGAAYKLSARDSPIMERVIYSCAELHLQHIAGSDPFEQGSSRPLDFGHWAAHKLEQLTNYRLRHGEAVAIGIALDSTYSYLSGLLPEVSWLRILTLFHELGFSLYETELSTERNQLLQGLNEFREHLGGQLTIMLLHEIGKGVEVHEIDRSRMVDSLDLLRKFDKARRPDQKDVHLSKQFASV